MDFEIKLNVNNITSDINKKLKQINQVPTQAYGYFKAVTPIRSGNARSRTSLSKNVIHAEYPYAERLDNGYSRQAPNGMVKPTEAFVKKTMNNIIRKK